MPLKPYSLKEKPITLHISCSQFQPTTSSPEMALFYLRRRTLSISSSLLYHLKFQSYKTITPHPSISPILSFDLKDQNQKNPIHPESLRFFRSSTISFSPRQPIDDIGEIGPDTILFEGCDYNHWLITMEFPQEYTSEQKVQGFVDTAAKILGSEEEAKKKIYACSTTTYCGFQVECSEEVSEKFKDLPGVVFVLPDSYIDPVNKEYGGDKYINGTIIPRPPPIQYRRRDDRSGFRDSRPRNFGPPHNPPPQQNYGSPQGPPRQQNHVQPLHQPPHQNYKTPQGPPPQQNYGQPVNPPSQQNYGRPLNSPPQQNYSQPMNPLPQQNYCQPPNPPPLPTYGQPLNPPPQQNYGYPMPQQNYSRQPTSPPQNLPHQQNYGNQQNFESQLQYGHRENFSPPNYGTQRTNFPNQQNYGPTGGLPHSASVNTSEGWNNYQGDVTSPDKRKFSEQAQGYMNSLGGGIDQGGGSPGQEVGPSYGQNYTRNQDQMSSQCEHGEQSNYADMGARY